MTPRLLQTKAGEDYVQAWSYVRYSQTQWNYDATPSLHSVDDQDQPSNGTNGRWPVIISSVSLSSHMFCPVFANRALDTFHDLVEVDAEIFCATTSPRMFVAAFKAFFLFENL